MFYNSLTPKGPSMATSSNDVVETPSRTPPRELFMITLMHIVQAKDGAMDWYQSQRLNRATITANQKLNNTQSKWIAAKKTTAFKPNLWKEKRNKVLGKVGNLEIETRHQNIGGQDMIHKMKRSRCYVCLKKGHAYWNFPAMVKDQKLKQNKGKSNEDMDV
ncbi:hypothetical protein L1987_40661 [Smallanthus sonchifolius]|uniref:Uncharacterized protein n=1 Tax=Smallanthus sonchifolius TaxID=185202 RepID=A0ACB9GSX7_9ASTR|nr:hypothetical protein L1987_40661 [Smallanthus sonchifolius]